MRKFVMIPALAAVVGAAACSVRPASPSPQVDSVAAHAPRRGDAWPGETNDGTVVCTTVVTMKPNHVVLRSGGCPPAIGAIAVRQHSLEVDAAIRALRPGEQTTVSTAVPTVSSSDR